MPTIHMDIDQCRSTQSSMVNQHTQLTQALQAISSGVNGIVGSAWIGQSATEFQQQYDQLRSAIQSQLDQLNQLNTSFSNEITQWEQVSSGLG